MPDIDWVKAALWASALLAILALWLLLIFLALAVVAPGAVR